MMHTTSWRGATLAAAVLAALAVSCTTTPKPDDAAAGRSTAPSATATGTDPYAPGPGEDVRGAFATLQATKNDGCAKDCSSYLGRVNKEVQEMDMAMKASPKGAGHFPEPIDRIAELNGKLAGDTSPANLEKHKQDLIGTRDFINTWMQDHPDDYR
ncbi:hypothetical protein [Streptomyces sp. NPDC058486]|uniref:hypothetical protein n=1 Tax=unclassified Streptomyces TaxID=2593676 RepID=UPI00365946F0